MGSFASGMKMGMDAWNSAEQAKRQKTLDDRATKEYERKEKQWATEDKAVADYDNLVTNGKRNDAGIQANDADFDRAVEATGRGLPMPAAAPQAQEWLPATDIDKNRGLQAVSRARGDWNGVVALQKEEKSINLDAGRKAELKRLSGLAPDELAEVVGSDFSRDGSGIDAMLTYDPKANKYLFASKVPGLPSQSLSRAELLNHAMGIWETGNGDFNAGMQTTLATMKAQRELETKNFDRSATLAQGNADLHFKGLNAEDARKRTAMSGAELGLRQAQANKPDYIELLGPDNTVRVYDRNKLPQVNGELTLPPGLRFKGQRPEIDRNAVTRYAATLVGTQMPGLSAGAKKAYDPASAYEAALAQLYPDQARASTGGLTATPPPARGKDAAPASNPPATPAEKKAPVAPSAPTLSTDGGKTWTLDVPKTIRDPSVAYYREIQNPMAVLGSRTFASRQEAEAAFAQMNK